jgi:hypothetical protein
MEMTMGKKNAGQKGDPKGKAKEQGAKARMMPPGGSAPPRPRELSGRTTTR